jgi:hypothetical protein
VCEADRGTHEKIWGCGEFYMYSLLGCVIRLALDWEGEHFTFLPRSTCKAQRKVAES